MLRLKLTFIAFATCVFMLAVSSVASAKEDALLTNPTSITIYGVPLKGGGCEYSGTMAGAPGTAVRQKAIYQDTSSCTMVIEQGEPVTRKVVDRKDGSSKTSTATITSGQAAKNGGVATLASNYHSVAYLHTWLEDPPNADVNSVTNYIDWWWNGSYVTSGYANDYRWWLTETGWSEREHNLQAYIDGNGRAVSSTYSHFVNPWFCFTIDTHALYNRNNIRGAGNGWWSADWNVNWWGGCYNLLDFDYEAGSL